MQAAEVQWQAVIFSRMSAVLGLCGFWIGPLSWLRHRAI